MAFITTNSGLMIREEVHSSIMAIAKDSDSRKVKFGMCKHSKGLGGLAMKVETWEHGVPIDYYLNPITGTIVDTYNPERDG